MAKAKSKAVLKAEKHEYDSQKKWKPLTSPEKLKEHQEDMAAKKAEAEAPPLKKSVQHVDVKRDPKTGQLLPGTGALNKTGRPMLGTNRLELLLTAIRKVETKENKKILEHFCERAFTDDGVLIALIKKLHPDLSAVAMSSLTTADDSMTDEMALHIQQQLRERYCKSPAKEESETPPISESEAEKST